jgi:hypothetical protein
MKDSKERKPLSGAKKAVITAGAWGGGVLGGAAAGMLVRRKKLRIGTPLSKVSVAKHMPIKLRQAVGRELSAITERIGDHLREFGSIESTLFLREFAGDRDRDGAGRFANGRVPSADDFAIAAASRKKKAAVAAGAVTAGALATNPGRAAAASIGTGLARTAGRLLR